MYMFVIYKSPRDFPGVPFVVRRWDVSCNPPKADADDFITCDSLQDARFYCTQIRHCTVRLDRMEGDDPVVVESWIQ